jgi:putative hemolysin
VVKLHDLIKARGTAANLVSLAFQPLVVPESKRVTGLLADMQDQGIHLAIVVDEYGVTVGLVTIEDVAEEMLGTISDAETAPRLEQIHEGLWLASGSMPVEDLAMELGIGIPDGDWNTVAGMMLGISGEILDTGSVVEVAGHRLKVASVRGRRITRVEIEARPDADR